VNIYCDQSSLRLFVCILAQSVMTFVLPPWSRFRRLLPKSESLYNWHSVSQSVSQSVN